MLWLNVILGSNFIFLCFKLIIIHYHTQKQRKIKFEPRIKLNHNIYICDCLHYFYGFQDTGHKHDVLSYEKGGC